MLKSKKRILTALLAMLMLSSSAYASSPKREWRSTWLTTVWAIDWPKDASDKTIYATSTANITKQKAAMTNYLDQLKAMNMTSVCFQVRSMCDAMYESSYEPWSSYLTGSRGTDPGWDPLAFVVEECHKRGLECYAWVNPYRYSTQADLEDTWTTTQDKALKNNGMLISNSYSDGSSTKYITTLNPGLESVRTHIVNVCKEIITKYAVDGMLFDDYFYPNHISEGSDAPDYSLFKNSGTSLSIGDWRRANVNQMVKDVYDMIQVERPDVRFGIGPAGVAGKNDTHGYPTQCPVSASDWQYSTIYSDPLAWLEEGTIDFISPQIYWHTDYSIAPYGPICEWWSNVANYFNRHMYSSVSITDMASDNSEDHWSEHVDQIKLNRQYTKNNSAGTNFYSTKYLNGPGTSGLGDYVKENAFTSPSLIPVASWVENAPEYAAVSNLALSSGSLSWTAVSNDDAIIRYTVYAVPQGVTLSNATASDGDGIDNMYLQGVTYANTYTLDSSVQGDYWYAVCVYDGYGNEHPAAYLNYAVSDAVTLGTPVNGAVASWNNTFTWSEIPGATYKLEIAEDADFTSVVYTTTVSTNSATLDLYLLEDAKTYYWRVTTIETAKIEAVSSVATFTSPTRTAAPKATLASPANGAEIEDDFTLTWNTVTGAETYTLEVSASSTFSTIKYSKELEATTASQMSQDMTISQLGKGTYYWRVVTGGKYYTSTASDSRSFTITKVEVGNYESGYTVKVDNSTYADAGTVKISSLWMRSVVDGYENITFENNGGLNRGMCAVGNYVFVSGRSEASTSATIYLRKYDRQTGEHISDIILDATGAVSYLPCNDVIKDSNGNVMITNLVTKAESTPLKLFLVNLETGALTEKASVNVTKTSGRIDHAAVYGDVTTGNFTLYAALSNTKYVVRWTFMNGTQTSEEVCTLSSVSSLGIAPRVIPINDDSFFADGCSTAFARYSFSTGATIDKITTSSLAPTAGVNGGTYFSLNGKNYIVYSFTGASSGYSYNVALTDDDLSLGTMSLLWTLPEGTLGTVDSVTGQAVADYVADDENSGTIYLYVPGCGIAAYKIEDNSGDVSVLEESIANDCIGIKVEGKRVVLSSVADNVELYDVVGSCVARSFNVSSIEANVAPGVYVVVATVDGVVYKKKVIFN